MYVAGLALFPRRWAATSDGLPAAAGVALYVTACWTAATQRDLPLRYVIPLFAALFVAIALARARSLAPVVIARLSTTELRRDWASFCVLYALVYLMLLPAAGDAFLPLAPANNVDLVTHARYARHALELGTPADLHLAPFGYRRSPATSYLIAWTSWFFARDPLTAAMPTLLAVASVFGLVTMKILRSAGVDRPASMAIAGLVVSGPVFRSVVSAYGLPELVAATALLMAFHAVVAVLPSGARTSAAVAIVSSSVLLFLAEPLSADWMFRTAHALSQLIGSTTPPRLLGWPGRLSEVRSAEVITAAPFLLLVIVLIWTALSRVLVRASLLDRVIKSATDRRLSTALPTYAIVALVIGNLVVDAIRDPASARVTAAWRGMEQVNQMPFGGLTLKMSDGLDSLSTAIALYYLPAKRTTVIGPEVSDRELSHDAVSRQTPMFIQDFGCAGAGHDDTVAVDQIGCLILSPPTATLGTRYPFNRRFLFLTYDGLTARTPEGRFNTRSTLALKVMADPQRARLDAARYLNLLVSPRMSPGGKAHTLVFTWGRHPRTTLSVDRRMWVTVPLDSQDWTGNRLWSIVVDIDLPDERPTLFEELSLTEVPQGRLVSGEPAR